MILVTGGRGFLGRYVVRELRRRGHDVLDPGHGRLNLMYSDNIRDFMLEKHPDQVIHLAARVGGIGANVARPGEFFYENALMGIELMEQARRFHVEKMLTVGTACMYPNEGVPVPLAEEFLWEGYPAEETAPYAMAKKALLVMGRAYREQYDFNAIYLIPTNLYGPEDSFDLEMGHVIPAMIRKFCEADADHPVRLWGTGLNTRDFIYVEDAARAIATALERYDSPDPMNVGTGVEVRIDELAREIKNLTGYEGAIMWNADKPGGAPRRCLDVSRSVEQLGVYAETSLREGLARTIEWWRAQR